MKSYNIKSIFYLAATLLLLSSKASAQGPWKFATEKDGIKVYSRSVPNSKVKALRVTCTLDATLSSVVTLLLDVPATPQWVSHTKSCTLIKRVSPAELYYYSEVSLPWPLENRDFVAHVKVTQDKATKVVIVDAPAIPGMIDVKKGIVRVSHSLGYWVITPLGNGKIKVDYSLQVDPGGIIPAWAVNALSSQGPLDSFMEMKKMLQKNAYKNAVLSFIEN